MNSGYGIGEHTEKSHHQHREWRLRKVKWLSTMIGGSYTMALVKACNDIIIKSTDDLEVLMNAVRIFTDDITMKFCIKKCAALVIKRGQFLEDDGIQMPGAIAIGDMGDGAYEYIE